VKVAISPNEESKPAFRKRGTNSNTETPISITGTAQLRNPLAKPTRGDFFRLITKAWCASNLLVAVYTNNRINNAATISIALENAEGFMSKVVTHKVLSLSYLF
jgi:hypothetical protein